MNEHYISFDLDDTLFDNKPVIGHAFSVLYDYLIAQYPNLVTHFSLEAFVKAAHSTRNQHADIVDYNVLRIMHIERVLAESGYSIKTIDADKACDIFVDARQAVTLFDQTLPTIQKIALDYPVISISNGNAEPNRIGLKGYFMASFNPSNCGFAKPNPAMYNYVCEQMNILPKQLIHIGDCLTNDVFAAKKAGCQSIWFNRLQKRDDFQPQVSALGELHELITELTHA